MKNGTVLGRFAHKPHILDISKDTIHRFEEKNELVEVVWPFSISNFPESERLAPESDNLYIRDLIDAISSNFYYKPDDSIRRIILALFINY